MAETFRTVGGRGEARFEVRGSEFVGHAAPVGDVEEAEAFVASVREQYDDATHNVPAYRVRRGELVREYESDAGEPSGSSGGPALNVLQQRELLNVAAVVTRYYGGTNLGVGGLARAYGRAVKEAVDDVGVVQRRPHETLSVTVDYDDSGTVRGVLESEGHEFDADYGERVGFEVRVPVEESDALRDRLASATSGRAEME
jgi:uncharacterized YigZ family protein